MSENIREFCDFIDQEPRNLETPDILTNRISGFPDIL